MAVNSNEDSSIHANCDVPEGVCCLLHETIEGQNVHSIIVVLPDGASDPQYQSVPNVCHSEIQNKMYLTSEPTLLNHSNLKMDKINNHAPCSLDIDIEKGKGEILKSAEESIGYLKLDDSSARALQREICKPLGGKLMQFLMNLSSELSKITSKKDRFVAERAYDAPSNRSRKHRGSPSFNSRRVLLLFSVMSSVGTIILIYLTLRVRVIADGSGNV